MDTDSSVVMARGKEELGLGGGGKAGVAGWGDICNSVNNKNKGKKRNFLDICLNHSEGCKNIKSE